MNSNRIAATLVAAFFSQLVWAAAPVSDAGVRDTPVIDDPRAVKTSSVFAASQSALEQRLQKLERILTARNQVQLDTQNQLNDLADELAELSGTIERHTYELQQMVVRQREIYQELDRRFAQLNASPVQPQATATTEPAAVSADEDKAYDRAVTTVMQEKNFPKAVSLFQQFLKDFPESGYASNVHYWLGQLFYTQGESGKAASQFETVVDSYGQSSKVAESLVKLGVIAAESGESSMARGYFEQVLARFPDSSAAGLARGHLSKL